MTLSKSVAACLMTWKSEDSRTLTMVHGALSLSFSLFIGWFSIMAMTGDYI